MQRYKILGPPGTGKTTRLLELLEKELDTVPARRIAFVSFTQRGTYEGVRRAKEQFVLSQDQLKHFRTLHSLCLQQTGGKYGRVMQKSDYKALGQALGMKFDMDDNALAILSKKNDATYLAACSLAMHNPAMYEKLAADLNYGKLLYVAKNLQAYKEQQECIDFTDMLFNYYKYGDPLNVDVAFVDEAQDLTALQWAIVDKMFANVKRLYIAGDDDQAIYTWAGADVAAFLQYPTTSTEVLKKSNRLPIQVYKYATNILKGISYRTDKRFIPREEQGERTVATSWHKAFINLDRPTLVLARDRAELRAAATALQELGFTYTYKGEQSFPNDARKAISKYEAWRKEPDNDKPLKLNDYEKKHYVVYNKDAPWYTAFKNHTKAKYFQRVLAREEHGTKQDFPIELSTIHASKGAEREHVILSLGYREKTDEGYRRDPDSELRCLYVGATRAKEKLTLKLKEGAYGYPSFLPPNPSLWLDDVEKELF